METTSGESQLYAVLIADGETLSQNKLTPDETGDELQSRFFVATQARRFTVRFGTYSECLQELRLSQTEFKSGRSGFAARMQASISGRTWHFRANVVRQDEAHEYGVTIAVKRPEPEPSLSWLDQPAKQRKTRTRPTSETQAFDARSMFETRGGTATQS